MIRLPPVAFRITRGIYVRDTEDALAGTGGVVASGRWHTMGQPVVYASESYALAQLERIVRGDEMLAERSSELVRLSLVLPPEVSWEHLPVEDLARRDPLWRTEGNSTCQRIGDVWLRRRRSAVLLVPSAVSPPEWNLLINPNHADTALIVEANQNLSRDPVEPDVRVVALLGGVKRSAS